MYKNQYIATDKKIQIDKKLAIYQFMLKKTITNVCVPSYVYVETYNSSYI